MSASRHAAVVALSRSAIGKPWIEVERGDLGNAAQGFAEHRDAEEAEHHAGDCRDELDVGLDDLLLHGSGHLVEDTAAATPRGSAISRARKAMSSYSLSRGMMPYQSCQKLAVTHLRPKAKALNDSSQPIGFAWSHAVIRSAMTSTSLKYPCTNS